MIPLHALLSSCKPKSQSLSWSDNAVAAFHATKEALAAASLLCYPQSDAPTSLATDASDTAIGAVLQQHIEGTWCPISFFSRKLTPAETRYSAFDKELLAIYLAIQHFRHFLEGRPFQVLTDHKPLTFALNSRSDHHSPRQARQLDYISQFTPAIRHTRGLDNVVADTLSRIETHALLSGRSPTVDFAAMAKSQASDPQVRSFQSSPSSSLVVEAIPLTDSSDPLLCDTSTGSQRLLVSLPWRRVVFDSLHGLSQPGIRATQKLITSRFVWPGINSDVRRWTRSCIQCQRAKIQRHTVAPLSSFTTPTARFDVIHINLVGPLPPSQGFTYLLTCVDRYTCWCEAIPLASITAEAVARAFLNGWISRFGVPLVIITDRGRQFESRLWANLMALCGSKRSRTTAYHPQSNGMVERFHRQLKAAITASCRPEDWMDALPLILLGVRTAFKVDVASTSAELVDGATLRLPGEFFNATQAANSPDPAYFVTELKSYFQSIRPQPPRVSPHASYVSSELATATHVFVRRDGVRKPLRPPYDGPFPVVRSNNKFFTISRKGRTDSVTIDRLKPAHLDDNIISCPSSAPLTTTTPASPITTTTHAPALITNSPRTTRSRSFSSPSCRLRAVRH